MFVCSSKVKRIPLLLPLALPLHPYITTTTTNLLMLLLKPTKLGIAAGIQQEKIMQLVQHPEEKLGGILLGNTTSW